jgi:hypothetical protein
MPAIFTPSAIERTLAAMPDDPSSDAVPEVSVKRHPSFWHDPLVRGVLAADAADNISTNLSPGVELNPLLPTNKVANLGMQGGLSALKALAIHKLDQKHSTLAKILAGLDIGIGAYDTANNVSVIGGYGTLPGFGAEGQLSGRSK